MDSISSAKRLASIGRLRDALDALNAREFRAESTPSLLLRSELLVALGRLSEAESTLALTKSRTMGDVEASHREFVKARIAYEHGDVTSEREHLQKSILFSERATDLERTCLAQLSLLLLSGDRSGSSSVDVLVAATRENVTRLGDPAVTAALHITVGQLDAQRGLVGSSLRHIQLAEKILKASSSLRWESAVKINLVGLLILQSRFDEALTLSDGALSVSTSLWRGTESKRLLG